MTDKQLTEKGAFISKSEAVMLQAVAVMLMVWHHLFGFPNRIAVPYVLVLDRFLHIETFLSYFGRICIAVFAFCSGYGMRKKIANSRGNTGILQNYKTALLQLVKFFSRYWIVFFAFIPIGVALRVYPVDIHRFFLGILGSGAGYNAEWWYVGYYVRFLMLFPVMTLLADIIQRRIPVLMHILMAIALLAMVVLPESMPYSGFIGVLLCFAEGMYFVDSDVFETLYRLLPGKSWIRLGVGLVLFGVVFVLRTIGLPDYLLVALFVFSIMLIVKSDFVNRWIRPLLMFVGKYSTYIWLTHTFFGYYFFQKLTFVPRYSWLIFLWCMVLSIASGMILEGLLTLLGKGFKKFVIRKK